MSDYPDRITKKDVCEQSSGAHILRIGGADLREIGFPEKVRVVVVEGKIVIEPVGDNDE